MKAKNVPNGLSRSRLARSFYNNVDTLAVARELLGKRLVVPNDSGERVSGRIVEVEAYMGVTDKAAHSYGGRRTQRNEVTYGEAGRAYVFLVYGMYNQLNFVLGPVGHAHVLLIRGVEPVEGVDVMRGRRGEMKDRDLTSGPGKLCIAFGIDRSFNGEDIVEGNRIWVEEDTAFAEREISAGKRIGIDYAGDHAELPWRFWVTGSPYVSRAR